MLPVRSYSVRMKRRNREAAASFRKNTARRKVGTTSTAPASHVPVRKTVSAGSTLPSEASKPAPRSPSSKSISSEPGISTTKDLKFETLLEEDEVEDKEEEEDKKVEEDGGDKEVDKLEVVVVATPDKGRVTFDMPEEDKGKQPEEIR